MCERERERKVAGFFALGVLQLKDGDIGVQIIFLNTNVITYSGFFFYFFHLCGIPDIN